MTLKFIERLLAQTYANLTIVIVDDGSTDGTAEAIAARYPEIQIIRGNGNLWWTAGTNLGVREALQRGCDYILTINNDAEIEPDFVAKMVLAAEKHPNVILGARIHYSDNREKIWCYGGQLRTYKLNFFDGNFGNKLLSEIHFDSLPNPLPVQYNCGNGTLIPAEVFGQVGLYDEMNYPQYHADSEFCMRAALYGFTTMINLDAVLYNDFSHTGRVHTIGAMLFSNQSPYLFRTHWHVLRYVATSKSHRAVLAIRLLYLYLRECIVLLPQSLILTVMRFFR